MPVLASAWDKLKPPASVVHKSLSPGTSLCLVAGAQQISEEEGLEVSTPLENAPNIELSRRASCVTAFCSNTEQWEKFLAGSRAMLIKHDWNCLWISESSATLSFPSSRPGPHRALQQVSHRDSLPLPSYTYGLRSPVRKTYGSQGIFSPSKALVARTRSTPSKLSQGSNPSKGLQAP